MSLNGTAQTVLFFAKSLTGYRRYLFELPEVLFLAAEQCAALIESKFSYTASLDTDLIAALGGAY